jgi:3-oxoacyl-[acyl-carrier-protein] synthase III
LQRDNSSEVFIRGFGQAKYEKKFDSSLKTENKLTEATNLALKQSGLKIRDIDGLGVSSFTLAPDRAIDLAVKFGIKPRWIMDGGTGGASGIDLSQHAMRAIQADDATNILLVAGDVFHDDDFTNLVSHYNVNTEASSANLGISGPNSNFALLTEMQMASTRSCGW